jgi:hypothetical protein
MSVDADLLLHVVCRNGARSILEILLASQWAGEEGGWYCAPMGEDPGPMERVDTREEVFALFDAKLAAGQMFGIRLWWDGGEHGADFMLSFTEGSHDRQRMNVSMLPALNRVKLDERTTDVSWYLPKLLPLFRDDSLLEGWTWEETP